jgi:nucleoid-associated protein YgaU
MPNDAKLGLIVGLALVFVVAIVSVNEPAMLSASPGRAAKRWGQLHTVQAGDTLSTLAERYYGSRDKADQILRANRDVLSNPEQMTPGTVLRIPAGDAVMPAAPD